MQSKHTTTKKRASAGSSSANKRARGTASQPILINSQPQLPAAPPSPSSLPITNTLQALTSASQAHAFEARVRESRAEEAIGAPAEGSEHATAAASRVLQQVRHIASLIRCYNPPSSLQVLLRRSMGASVARIE
jgi:hypothetical protein